MSEISRWLVTFLLNAVWQIAAIAALATGCAKLLYRMPSRYTHIVWALALVGCLVVPLATVVIQAKAGAPLGAATTAGSDANETVNHDALRRLSVPFHSLSHSISFPAALMQALLWAYGALLSYRAMRLGWLAWRTARIRQCAYARPMPAALTLVAERCMRSFSLRAIPVLCSIDGHGPTIAGFRHPVLILPEIFFTASLPEDDLLSALSHELAHIRRRDFVFNLLYEMLYVPVCFHPCAAFVRARIAQTRELACDEMAAQMLPSGARYARSLLHIAQSLCSGARSKASYAFDLFDTNSLEERIMNMLNTTTGSRKWTSTLRLAAACLAGGISLGISAFSLQLAPGNTADLGRFAGTWEAKYKGKAFFTLKMSVTDGVLGGTSVHTTRVAWVDGQLIPGSDETTTDKIVEAHASGHNLTLKIADGNSSDVIPLELKLTGKDEAEGRTIVDQTAEVPPQQKPWHFQRVSTAH